MAPFKISFFDWEASHGSIFLCDNLQKGQDAGEQVLYA